MNTTAPPSAARAASPIDTWMPQVRALPPLPEALQSALAALRQAQLSDRRCIALIECDPALAARVLRVANSAFYGLPGRVASIGDAVHLLGLRSVAGVLAAVSLRDAIQVQACPAFDFNRHWRHAVATGVAARLLARRTGQDADAGLVAGLLHDVGQLLVAAFRPEQADRVIRAQQQPGLSDSAALAIEQSVLGLTHGPLGALLLQHWQLPAAIVQAVADHHASPVQHAQGASGLPGATVAPGAPGTDASTGAPLAQDDGNGRAPLTRLLQAANVLAQAAESPDMPPAALVAHCQGLGLAAEQVPTLITQVVQEAVALHELLNSPA